MNLLYDLEAAKKLEEHCESTLEVEKARMNFVVNLVTILEIHSRNCLANRLDDQLLEGDFTYNTICKATPEYRERRKVIKYMLKVRNKYVHEGKLRTLGATQISSLYNLVKAIVSDRLPL
jgi:hypothetical protein